MNLTLILLSSKKKNQKPPIFYQPMSDSKSKNSSALISTDLLPPSQEHYSILSIMAKWTEPSSISSSEKIKKLSYYNSIGKNLFSCKKTKESL